MKDPVDPPRSAWPQAFPALAADDFQRLAGFIEERYGIRLPPAKKALLESRLGRRIRELGLPGFGAYCDRVLAGHPEELVQLVDRVTTHKTDFFREPQHFEVLARLVVPELASAGRIGPGRELRVWSAACSTGEEPYSLAMALAEETARRPELGFRILATDLSPAVLRFARSATYTEQQVEPIPLELRRRYLLRSVEDAEVIRVRRSLRERVEFRELNLLDGSYGPRGSVDVAFCRNVLIYFGRKVQERVVGRLAEALAPGGYLFVGHSESAHGLSDAFEPVSPTVYRRRGTGRESPP